MFDLAGGEAAQIAQQEIVILRAVVAGAQAAERQQAIPPVA